MTDAPGEHTFAKQKFAKIDRSSGNSTLAPFVECQFWK